MGEVDNIYQEMLRFYSQTNIVIYISGITHNLFVRFILFIIIIYFNILTI